MANEKIYKYRLEIGSHAEGFDKVNPETKELIVETVMYHQGDCFASSDPKLVERFGADKFTRLPANYDLSVSAAAQEGFNDNGYPSNNPNDLSTMTEKELRDLAENDEIPIGNAKTKEQLIKAINASKGVTVGTK